MNSYFHKIPPSLAGLCISKHFTNPFDYFPNDICIWASKEVISYIKSVDIWKEEVEQGKMFGILIVENKGQLGYLAAFSGNLINGFSCGFFVPPIYNLLDREGFFKKGEKVISKINEDVKNLENSSFYKKLLDKENIQLLEFNKKIEECKHLYIVSKKHRDELRRDKEKWDALSGEEKERLIIESQYQKGEIKRAQKRLDEVKKFFYESKQEYLQKINFLKNKRKTLSIELQNRIFESFKIYNFLGDSTDLLTIFKNTPQKYPPAGAGECAAPRLLQYAYLNGFNPISMAEFWLGNSPKGEIRHSGEFYPACKGKCKPILDFMLKGLDVDNVSCHKNYGKGSSLSVVYEDNYLIVVNKPAGMLSVPGKYDDISVLQILKQMFPLCSQLALVHRLDMHTSGVMIAAKNWKIYKELQKQFTNREIKKVYIALLEGILDKKEGIISLPLIGDYNNRPMQKVDYLQGKESITKYKLLNVQANKSLVEFYPLTGRTHQLRIHSAYSKGLNAPIVGDILYGKKDERLMLHCLSLEFIHPITKKVIHIESKKNLNFLNNF